MSSWQQRVRVVSQAPGVVAVIDSRTHVATEAERVRLAVVVPQAVVVERC